MGSAPARFSGNIPNVRRTTSAAPKHLPRRVQGGKARRARPGQREKEQKRRFFIKLAVVRVGQCYYRPAVSKSEVGSAYP